jgi:outer membrane protein OmpA-like peptidoglycan-associated protein
MVTHYKMPKQPIDDKKATRWGIASLNSVGVSAGPVGVSLGLYDLVNMETYRAHRVALKSGGIGKGFKAIPISGSFLSGGYTYFTTSRPANFPDFDGAAARLTEVNLILYSWTWLTVLDGASISKLAYVKSSGTGLTIPNAGTGGGVLEVFYSDGQPVDTPEFQPELKLESREDLPMKVQYSAHEDAIALRIQGDMLFDFDKYTLKPQADKTLSQAAAFIRSKTGFRRVSIEGHTDSKGSNGYNMTLSKNRARSVANWFISRRLLNAPAVDIEGKGETDPDVPNTRPDGSDDPVGRAKNRRVEIWLVK